MAVMAITIMAISCYLNMDITATHAKPATQERQCCGGRTSLLALSGQRCQGTGRRASKPHTAGPGAFPVRYSRYKIEGTIKNPPLQSGPLNSPVRPRGGQPCVLGLDTSARMVPGSTGFDTTHVPRGMRSDDLEKRAQNARGGGRTPKLWA